MAFTPISKKPETNGALHLTQHNEIVGRGNRELYVCLSEIASDYLYVQDPGSRAILQRCLRFAFASAVIGGFGL